MLHSQIVLNGEENNVEHPVISLCPNWVHVVDLVYDIGHVIVISLFLP